MHCAKPSWFGLGASCDAMKFAAQEKLPKTKIDKINETAFDTCRRNTPSGQVSR
jgi:hypothetical protein